MSKHTFNVKTHIQCVRTQIEDPVTYVVALDGGEPAYKALAEVVSICFSPFPF